PLDTSLLVVSALLPGVDFSDKPLTVREAPIKTLAIKNTNFDFRHIQPTGVLWRVVKDHASQEFICRLDSEHMFEALAERGVQIVKHEMNAIRLRVDLLQQVLDEGHEIRLGTMISNLHDPLPTLGLDCHKQ